MERLTEAGRKAKRCRKRRRIKKKKRISLRI